MSTSESPEALIVESAVKTYRGFGVPDRQAVSDVSFRVSPGEIHGLLGPNGAGKTTTLKMLLGLVSPTAGRFEILGRPAGPSTRKTLGFLPEQPYFPVHLTAGEVLSLYGRLSGLTASAIQGSAADLLERVGLQGRESTQLRRFSRGMLQRLGIAAALLHEPDVVVMDEPASGLDPVGQRDTRNLMLGLRERGVAVLLSSHQLSEVEAVCDGVTILNRGVVAAEGDIDSLLHVAGEVSVRAKGPGDELPESVRPYVRDVAFSGGEVVFSFAEESIRQVVDALDDSGWALVALEPKRASLEDYFARLLADSAGEVRP